MTKAIQILLLAAFLFPMFGSAQEETLEERKKRVTRKYLRERMNVSQSEMVVPEDLTEDVRVLDSEKFKEATVDLQRQAATTPPPPPMPRRPMPEQADSNWLLNDIDNKEVDLYADPFAPSKPSDDRPDYRSMIRDRKSDDQATGSSRSSIYDPYASLRYLHALRGPGDRWENGDFRPAAKRKRCGWWSGNASHLWGFARNRVAPNPVPAD
jgi:hypothetical protein